MQNIMNIDHVGIRVAQRDRAVKFYGTLGFQITSEHDFSAGQPVIMEHPSGVVINLLGPANAGEGTNILMDVEAKHAGYTHMALRVDSLERAKEFLAREGIELSGEMAFGEFAAVFVRDPDRNVIEFNAHPDRPGLAADYSEHP